VYDALTSKRCYKEPMPHDKARDIILKDAGTHFDPAVAATFDEIHPEFDRIRAELGN
jgi:putative two-component system response regulator